MNKINELWQGRPTMNRLGGLDLTSVPLSAMSTKNSRQILWHLYYGIYIMPQCNHVDCITETAFHIDTRSYRLYCSAKCANSSKSKKEDVAATNLKKYNGHPMSTDKVQAIRKASHLQKYGVEHQSQRETVKAAKQQTNLFRHNHSCSLHSEKARRAAKDTCNERYGTDHYSQSDQFKIQFKQASQEKYGVDNPFQSEEVKHKIKKTCQEIYGVDFSANIPARIALAKKTNIERYGHENPLGSPEIQAKAAHTNIERYGAAHYNQSHIPITSLEVLQSLKKLTALYSQCKNTITMAKMLGVVPSTVYNYLQYHGIDYSGKVSYLEAEMRDWLDSIGIEYITNSKQIISPFELDFYLPTHNIAIEMNGIYWHSEKFKHKNYHYDKWKLCHDQDIHLISIFEDQWLNDLTKVKAAIISLLGHRHQKTIGARKLQILPVNSVHARPFLNLFHLQGYVTSTHFGAFNDMMQLVGIMSFGMSRNQDFELKRFVTDSKHSYPGLASKMFKYAHQELQFDNVVSFSDNTWFTGKMYKKLGFADQGTIPPAYKYFYKGKLVHCSTFTKKGIVTKFPHMTEAIDNGMTEKQAMIELCIPRVYDCGKRKWTWNI